MRNTRKFILFLAAVLFCTSSAVLTAQEKEGVSVGMLTTPGLSIPVGSNADLYTVGFSGRVAGQLGFGRFPYISPRLDVSYNFVPVNTESNAALSLIRASVGAQGNLPLGERVVLFGYGTAGGYYGLLAGPIEANDLYLSFHGGLGVSLQLFNNVSFSAGAEYDSFYGTFDDVSVFLGVSARFAGLGGGAVPKKNIAPLRPGNLPASGFIQIQDIQLTTVFPVLRKYYDTAPIGSAVITNTSEENLEAVEVRVKPAKYIDSTKLSTRIPELAPGAEVKVDLYALFNEQILNVSEGAKVVTDINVNYRVNGRDGSDTETVTLDTYDRNALQWDDDEKIAAFVTAKDDEIQRFAKNMASLAQDVRIDAVNQQLQLAMIQFAAMVEHELTYVVDPSSAYEELSDNPLAIDFVQFPRQTLYVKAGDCDDLSATYCTLLESLGIDTAFITVPGHIFTAFRLEMDRAEAERTFSNTEDLLFRDDGTVWIPVETTLLEEDFLQAWSIGAKQWRTYFPEKQTGFFETKDAWIKYQPVAFSVSQIELGMPQRDAVVSRVRQELDAFISREIYPREQKLLARINSGQNDPRSMNKLGVLYARYGQYSEARGWFEKSADNYAHVPALINLANIHYINGDYGRARDRYEEAIEQNSQSASALLGLARVEHELENFGSAREAYDRLASVSPDIAEKYSYLRSSDPGAERAAGAAANRTSVLWEEAE